MRLSLVIRLTVGKAYDGSGNLLLAAGIADVFCSSQAALERRQKPLVAVWNETN